MPVVRPRGAAWMQSGTSCRQSVVDGGVRGGLRLLAGLTLGDAEHDVARLLPGLDVAGRLDDLVERVRPVDHWPVPSRVDELLDQQEVRLAIAADAESPTRAPGEPGDDCEERH